MKFKTVPDTNIIIATQSKNPKSPNREYFERWLYNDEFDLLYSEDTLLEYSLKLRHKGFSKEKRKAIIKNISKLGFRIYIEFFHLRAYPEDPDDVVFVLCAQNGNATHLISYDKHILDLKYRSEFDFKICQIIEFLQELRESQNH
ncbi:Nucleic acid-binding protein contains PIN domain-like protein [Desulfamplus magnetovallimortis]|uniref:Nucleic acid-binding protein contains PIN domain-like protein n=1 Tax=Desulfamplus magnetovallimortis TaxID=1246637 RepID=A0A1W1HDJ9_9BACT|nr:PIN domain-containing protein [Desulfamplus magnetovallimortis]SLM30574.1 Nucleic acid-binding protein contains PIN domain-like protein [Desulfamplus magnetovallimortis]